MKVTPSIKRTAKTINYSDIKDRECFVYNGHLYIKDDGGGGQYAICLDDPSIETTDGFCGVQVQPVKSEIKWSYMPVAKKKLGKKKALKKK